MSLGGIRDPLDPNGDSFSRLEADAVAYAVSNGVVVVAAVGNGDQAPMTPWRYASYPAALPHVLGVSAVAQDGGPEVLEPRPDLQRHRRAGPADPLDPPPPADLPLPGLLRAGVLELRARGVPRGPGDLLRNAPGECRGSRAPEPPAHASRRAGHAILRSSAVDSTPRPAAPTAPSGATRSPDGGGWTSRPRSRRSTGRSLLRDRYEANDDAGHARTSCSA